MVMSTQSIIHPIQQQQHLATSTEFSKKKEKKMNSRDFADSLPLSSRLALAHPNTCGSTQPLQKSAHQSALQ